jgi:hypothetical protein
MMSLLGIVSEADLLLKKTPRRDLLAGLSVVPKPPPIHRTASTPPARVA